MTNEDLMSIFFSKIQEYWNEIHVYDMNFTEDLYWDYIQNLPYVYFVCPTREIADKIEIYGQTRVPSILNKEAIDVIINSYECALAASGLSDYRRK